MQQGVTNILQHWLASWRDSLMACVAGSLAWPICEELLGQPKPIFAMVTGVACLAPNLPNHGKQAIRVVLGVTAGVIVAELSLFLPQTVSVLHTGMVAFIAMVLATTFGTAPAIPIQAGVSAILVLAMGPQEAGLSRLTDVLVGAGVGLLFSQILLTPDPVRVIDRAVRGLLEPIASGLKKSAAVLKDDNPEEANTTITQFIEAHRALVALSDGLALVRSDARWSLRGRLVASEITDMASRYERRGIRLYAAALLFGEALGNALRKKETEPPAWLMESLQIVIANCSMEPGREPHRIPPIPKDLPFGWRECVLRLEGVQDTLLHFLNSDQPDSVLVPKCEAKPQVDAV